MVVNGHGSIFHFIHIFHFNLEPMTSFFVHVSLGMEFSDTDHGINTTENALEVRCSSGGVALNATDATMVGDECVVTCAAATQRFHAGTSGTWVCTASANESEDPEWVNSGSAPTTCIDGTFYVSSY